MYSPHDLILYDWACSLQRWCRKQAAAPKTRGRSAAHRNWWRGLPGWPIRFSTKDGVREEGHFEGSGLTIQMGWEKAYFCSRFSCSPMPTSLKLGALVSAAPFAGKVDFQRLSTKCRCASTQFAACAPPTSKWVFDWIRMNSERRLSGVGSTSGLLPKEEESFALTDAGASVP